MIIVRLATALRKAINELEPNAVDKGAVELAMTYARAIDDGEALSKYGPLLLNVLESMLMTPRARAAVLKGGRSEPAKSPLDELRAKRDARKNGTKTVDAPAS